MVYGPRWEFPLPEDPTTTVVMRPAQLPNDAEEMACLLQDPVTFDFVSLDHSPTVAEELKHFEQVGENSNSFRWMVAVQPEGKTEELVGVTSLDQVAGYKYNRRLTSGILLASRAWWKHGIATATHRLRTWHAFQVQGAYAIESGFLSGNLGSGKALASVGYIQVGRNERWWLKNGQWRDHILLTCYNPAVLPVLWPEGDVPEPISEASERTRSALDWAQEVLQPR